MMDEKCIFRIGLSDEDIIDLYIDKFIHIESYDSDNYIEIYLLNNKELSKAEYDYCWAQEVINVHKRRKK